MTDLMGWWVHLEFGRISFQNQPLDGSYLDGSHRPQAASRGPPLGICVVLGVHTDM